MQDKLDGKCQVINKDPELDEIVTIIKDIPVEERERFLAYCVEANVVTYGSALIRGKFTTQSILNELERRT